MPMACVTILVALAMPGLAPGQETKPDQLQLAQAEAVTLDIAPQALNDAMLEFADKTGIQIFYDAERVQGLSSPGVTGSYSRAQAIEQLLAGTGLSYRFTSDDAITLERPSNDSTIQLDAITVEDSETASSATAPLARPRTRQLNLTCRSRTRRCRLL